MVRPTGLDSRDPDRWLRTSPDRLTRQGLERLGQGVVALAAQAAGLQRPVELEDRGRPEQRDPERVGRLEHQPQVLLLQVDGEAGPPVAGHDLRTAVGQHPRARRRRPGRPRSWSPGRGRRPGRAAAPRTPRACCTTTRTWLTSLQVWPAPTGPTCVIVRPIASSTGRARSTSASAPPTMIDSVPFFAPSEPPETGAST